MKTKFLLTILSLVLISCTAKTDSKATKSLNQQDIILSQTDKNHEILVDNLFAKEKKKIKWFKKGLKGYSNSTLLPKSFIEFYPKFVSDSLFQKENISFDKLIGYIAECESTIILNSDNWTYDKEDFVKFLTEGNKTEPIEEWNNQVYSNEDKVLFEFEKKEIGMIYRIGFEKINDKWNLTFYFVNAC